MKKILALIANLNISHKIWLCMITISLTLSAFLISFSSHYFSRLYREDAYNQAADSLHIGAQSLTDSYDLLLKNVIDTISAESFSAMVQDVHTNRHEKEVLHKAALQRPLSLLTDSIPILDSLVILGKNGEYYSLYTNTLKKGHTPWDAFNWNFFSVHDITWMSVRPSPFIKNNQILPVVLPVSLVPYTHYLHICHEPENTDIYIVLLLDSKKVEERLALAASPYSERTLYIADDSGAPLSLPQNAPWYETASDERVKNSLRSCTESEGFKQVLDEKQYSLYSIPLDFCGLNLVSIVPKTPLHTRLARVGTFLILISLAGLMLTAFLSLILSRFLTRPLARLVQNVHRIENNTYDTPDQMNDKDEIGRLNMAINSMYETIQKQIRQIRENERDKYQAEIQLLSAQISPHFLYNTLECINMEILGDRKQAASAMITSLGDFMRIGLNYGNELIPLSRELLHVKSYIDIMNYRFSQKIELISTVSSELTDCLILKSILQPLAENSIRHGFSLDESGHIPVPMPEISINVFESSGILTIEVIDNGHGIDISRATEALSQDGRQPRSRHVGLNNVYARLKACYGTAQIRFETIPYFRNIVRITVPYKISNDHQREMD